MTELKNTKENEVFIKILKSMKETDWVGNLRFEDLETCLISVNMNIGKNGGQYTPSPIRLKGISNILVVNQDGSLCYDYRIIKEENSFLIETLTIDAFNKFEKKYCELI
tara:strand:- start:192 stop:518 length:327 start_codon:yes stop_codon:yes gene_type:complete